jgi:hypothetical protein
VAEAPALVKPVNRPLAAIVSVAALVAVGAAVVLGLAPPTPRPAGAPADEFSAERAYRHVTAVAAETHVAGSAANDRVRGHLTETLSALGLRVAEQDAIAPEAGQLSGAAGAAALARVRNVVAVLPGTAPTGRLFVVAHYDSVQVGPGGNDDGAGTATILEVARALAAGPRPRNDIVFVLTDAEEACLCGAAVFAREHPLARDGGVVLNLEARGSTGPVIMFETSERNAALVDVFGRAAPHPVGTSFAVEVYRLLPNDTDFTPFLDAGFAGLNSAYIDGGAVYHTPLDTPESMDRASLQQHGDNALALAREFGRVDLESMSAGGDATYFPVPGLLVRYPGWLTWPLAVLALLAVAGLAGLARRRRLLTWRRLAGGFALGLAPLILAPVAAQTLWWAITAIRPGYAELLDPYRPVPFRLAVLALAAAVVLGWYALGRRLVGPAALAVAALAWLAVLGLALAAVVPGGSYLAALPAFGGALAGLACLSRVGRRRPGVEGAQRPSAGASTGRHKGAKAARAERAPELPLPGRRSWGAIAAVTAGAAVAVLVLLPAAVLLFPALGMSMGGVGAFFTALLLFAALPVIDLLHPPTGGHRGMAVLRARRAAAAPTALAVVAALVLAGVGLRVDRFDAAHPVPTHLMYALDAGTGAARWLSHEADPQPWTDRYVDRTDDSFVADFPLLPDGLLAGPARPAAMPAPQVEVLSDTAAGDVRTLRVRLRPQRTVRLAGLYVDAATASVDRATVAGRSVDAERTADGKWSFALVFHAPPAEGIEVELALRPPPEGGNDGRVRLRVLDGSDGLTGVPGFAPRPPDVGVAGSHTSELLLVARTVTL